MLFYLPEEVLSRHGIGFGRIGMDLFYIRRKKKEACFRHPIYDQGRE